MAHGANGKTVDMTWDRRGYQEASGTFADGFSLQPRLHPQGRSHPQVRSLHLPSVLP